MSSITKHISFPAQLFSSMEKRSGEFGVSIAEYIRHLAMNDIQLFSKKSWEDSLPTYKASDELWSTWNEAKEEGVVMTAEEFKNR